MPPQQTKKRLDNVTSLFIRPKGVLSRDEYWLFLKNRYHLTSRETQIAILICRGFSNDEIAKALNISQSTVKTHLKNLFRRVRINSRILLLLRFIEDVTNSYGKI
jgi:DNA-binding NarL/FixJ family response regulator